MALDLSGYDTLLDAAQVQQSITDAFADVAYMMPDPGAYGWIKSERRDAFDAIVSENNRLDAAWELRDLSACIAIADRCRRLWLRAWELYREAHAIPTAAILSVVMPDVWQQEALL